jgi:small subunit ribosomal protein S4e
MANTRHLKRTNMPNSWPVKKKNITFVTKPNAGSHKLKYVTPVVVILREVLGYAQTAKDAKYIVHNEEVLVNGKKVTDVKAAVGMFDIFEITKTSEKFIVIFDEVGRLKLVSTKDSTVTLKIAGKSVMKNGKFQLNMMNGYNILVDEKSFKKANVEDSVVYDYVKKAVVKTLELKEGAQVYLFDGKFKGCFATVKGFTKYSGLANDLVNLDLGGVDASTTKSYCYVITNIKGFN